MVAIDQIIGKTVKLKEPFNTAFPHSYLVLGIADSAPDTVRLDIYGDGSPCDFHIQYIDEVV